MASILGSYLDDETQEMECFSAPDGDHDDVLSSLKIYKIGSAIGKWKALSPDVDDGWFYYRAGINPNSHKEDPSVVQDILTTSMKLGFEFSSANGLRTAAKDEVSAFWASIVQ